MPDFKNGVIHLKKAKNGQVMVAATASNGRVLFPTETFTQKPSAWTNVRSILKLTGGKSVVVQDNTITPAVVYLVTPTAKKETGLKPTKKIP